MQLRHIRGDVYYLPGVVNVGIIRGRDGQAILIDTGIGDRSGRQILYALANHGLRPVAILNTHAHGDHIGGNSYIVQQTGAKVYAPSLDSVVMQYPAWGTLFLFGGAEPIRDLAIPRFAPAACPVDVVVTEGEYEIAGISIRAIPLPGHTSTHTGYLVDEVLFLGDALASDQELDSTKIAYAYSVSKRLESLAKLQSYSCAWYILGHDQPHRDIHSLIIRNLSQMEDTIGFILHLLEEPKQAVDVLAAICSQYDVQIRNVRDYYLLHLTVHAYLSHLYNNGLVSFAIEGNRLFWRTHRL